MVAADYPVLSGAVSLDGAPLPPAPPGAETLHRAARIAVWRTGPAPETRTVHGEGSILVLFGRVFTDAPPALLARLLPHVQGSFVVVAAHADGRVELSTDRYGFRRLLYAEEAGVLRFATHLEGLRLHAPAVDADALLHHYNFGFTPNDRSLLEGVRKVPPGSTLAVDGGGVRITRYASLAGLYRPDLFAGPEEEVTREIDARLLRSVGRRTAAEGVVGVALSGGVDSGFVAQKAVQGGARVVGYTLAYGDRYDESGRIARLSAALGLEVRRIELAPRQVIGNFERASGLASEPLGFNNATMRFVAERARADGVRALLDGDGADRLFLGMNRHLLYERMLRAWRWAERAGMAGLAVGVLRLLPFGELRKVRLCFENWRRGIPPYAERGLGRARPYDEAYERRVYELAVARHREAFERELGPGDFGLFLTYLAIQMCPEMFFYDPGELGRELGICPLPAFFDDEVVEAALSIPTGWKLRDGQTKYILRRAAARNLDPRYWMLPKIGLQSARAFATADPAGRAWHRERLEQARRSEEARRLADVVPGGEVETERLIGLVVWKERHGFR